MANSIGRLDSNFTSLINDLMTIERQPLMRMTQTRDDLKVKKAMYSDMKKMFEEFSAMVKSLNSQEDEYSFLPGRSVKVTSDSADKQVLSAVAGQAAMAGAYRIEVSTLASGHKVRSDQQTYANQALGLSGSFILGGDVIRSQTTQSLTANTVVGFDVNATAEGQSQLGSGDYYIETRQDTTGTWQFRMVDAEGAAMSIQKASTSGEYTSGWQAIPTGGGEVDTGRGLKISLGSDSAQYLTADKGSGAARVSYRAEGAAIAVESSDSLIDIAYAINHARYAAGSEVTATIIDRQLILSTKQTGANQTIRALDVSGSVLSGLGIYQSGAFKNQMQTPTNALMMLNGLQVTRAKNTGLTDVIHGVTLNLAEDAKSQAATLTVEENTTNDRASLDNFVTKFNRMVKYLGDKLAVTKNADGTYKRGALAGDNVFSNLRLNLLRATYSSVSNTGSLKRLSDIGIEVNSDLQLAVSDSSKLETQLLNNRDNVVALMDGLMSQLASQTSKFSGTAGYLTQAERTTEKELDSAEDQISTFNTRMTTRENALRAQFAQAQAQILENQYMLSQIQTVYSLSWNG